MEIDSAKAACGIRTCADAVAMIEAGANMIGTSSATSVVKWTTAWTFTFFLGPTHRLGSECSEALS